jgi:hypothetical protein
LVAFPRGAIGSELARLLLSEASANGEPDLQAALRRGFENFAG